MELRLNLKMKESEEVYKSPQYAPDLGLCSVSYLHRVGGWKQIYRKLTVDGVADTKMYSLLTANQSGAADENLKAKYRSVCFETTKKRELS